MDTGIKTIIEGGIEVGIKKKYYYECKMVSQNNQLNCD